MGMNRRYRETDPTYKTRQTGSVAKWMGLSDEGVRLYERYQLIYPEKDERNKYRAFDVMDVTMLLYGMVYRESGFSLKEARQLANNSTLDEVAQAYQDKAHTRREELERELLRLERIEEIGREIEQVKREHGECRIEMRPAIYRLEFMTRTGMQGGASRQKRTNYWMKNYLPFAMLSTRYYQHTLNCERQKIEAVTGFGIYAKYAEKLGIAETEDVKYYPPVRAVHTILSGDNEMLNPDYSRAFQFIRDNKLRVCGDPIGFGIVNLHFGEMFDRYYHIWIPVEDDE